MQKCWFKNDNWPEISHQQQLLSTASADAEQEPRPRSIWASHEALQPLHNTTTVSNSIRSLFPTPRSHIKQKKKKKNTNLGLCRYLHPVLQDRVIVTRRQKRLRIQPFTRANSIVPVLLRTARHSHIPPIPTVPTIHALHHPPRTPFLGVRYNRWQHTHACLCVQQRMHHSPSNFLFTFCLIRSTASKSNQIVKVERNLIDYYLRQLLLLCATTISAVFFFSFLDLVLKPCFAADHRFLSECYK